MYNNFIKILFICSILVCTNIELSAFYQVESDSSSYIPSLEKTPQFVDFHTKQGRLNYKNNEFKKAIDNFETALRAVEHHQLSNEYLKLYQDIGDSHFQDDNYEKSIEYLNKFTRSKKFIENDTSITDRQRGQAMHRLSLSYHFLGDLINAFEYELENLAIAENLKDTILIWRANYQLGNILVFQLDYEGALEYYKKNEHISAYKRDDLKKYEYSTLGAMGSAYSKMDSLELALSYNKKAMLIAKEINYETGIAYSYHNLGRDYKRMKKYSLAEDHYFKSLKIKEKTKDKWGIASSYSVLGSLYTEMSQLKKAEHYLNEAEKACSNISAKPLLTEIYEFFIDLYIKKEDYKNAFKYQSLYLETNETIIRKTALRNLKAKKNKYEITKQENNLKISTTESKNKNYPIYIIYILLPFILILVILYSKIKKKERIISQKTLELQNLKS